MTSKLEMFQTMFDALIEIRERLDDELPYTDFDNAVDARVAELAKEGRDYNDEAQDLKQLKELFNKAYWAFDEFQNRLEQHIEEDQAGEYAAKADEDEEDAA